MATQTRKYIVSFHTHSAKRTRPSAFYEVARTHIVKGKRGGPRDLSRRVDEVAYGV